MISVTILTKNAARYLSQVLDSVATFDDVVILDSGSTDATETIALRYPNVRWFTHTFDGFGSAHNRAAAYANHAWILSLDADEVLSPALVEELHALSLNPQYVYTLSFKNYFRGRWIRGGGWYPKIRVRLYHRAMTACSEDAVHEHIIDKGLTIHALHAPAAHYTCDSISEFLVKMDRYSSLFAQQHRFKKHVSIGTALYHAFFAFIKTYFVKRGFIDGFEGFVIASYNAHTVLYKYLKLYEANHEPLSSNVSSCRHNRKACQL